MGGCNVTWESDDFSHGNLSLEGDWHEYGSLCGWWLLGLGQSDSVGSEICLGLGGWNHDRSTGMDGGVDCLVDLGRLVDNFRGVSCGADSHSFVYRCWDLDDIYNSRSLGDSLYMAGNCLDSGESFVMSAQRLDMSDHVSGSRWQSGVLVQRSWNLGNDHVRLCLDNCLDLAADCLDLGDWLIVSLRLFDLSNHMASLIWEGLGVLNRGWNDSLVNGGGSVSQRYHAAWQGLGFRDRAERSHGGCNSLINLSRFLGAVDSLINMSRHLGNYRGSGGFGDSICVSRFCDSLNRCEYILPRSVKYSSNVPQ